MSMSSSFEIGECTVCVCCGDVGLVRGPCEDSLATSLVGSCLGLVTHAYAEDVGGCGACVAACLSDDHVGCVAMCKTAAVISTIVSLMSVSSVTASRWGPGGAVHV